MAEDNTRALSKTVVFPSHCCAKKQLLMICRPRMDRRQVVTFEEAGLLLRFFVARILGATSLRSRKSPPE